MVVADPSQEETNTKKKEMQATPVPQPGQSPEDVIYWPFAEIFQQDRGQAAPVPPALAPSGKSDTACSSLYDTTPFAQYRPAVLAPTGAVGWAEPPTEEQSALLPHLEPGVDHRTHR